MLQKFLVLFQNDLWFLTDSAETSICPVQSFSNSRCTRAIQEALPSAEAPRAKQLSKRFSKRYEYFGVLRTKDIKLDKDGQRCTLSCIKRNTFVSVLTYSKSMVAPKLVPGKCWKALNNARIHQDRTNRTNVPWLLQIEDYFKETIADHWYPLIMSHLGLSENVGYIPNEIAI